MTLVIPSPSIPGGGEGPVTGRIPLALPLSMEATSEPCLYFLEIEDMENGDCHRGTRPPDLAHHPLHFLVVREGISTSV